MRDVDRDVGHRADADQQHVLRIGADEHIHSVAQTLQGGQRRADGSLRKADDRRGVIDRDRLAQLFLQSLGITRHGDADVRHDLQHREVPDAVVAGTVRAGHARAIEHERDAGAVKCDVHHHLIERAIHERRVDRHDRVQAAEGQTGGGGHRMLLGDAHVVDPIGEPLGEGQQARGSEHRRRDADDIGPVLSDGDELIGEHIRPRGRGRASDGFARERIDAPHCVELVGLVVPCGLIAAALLGDRVHDHGRPEVLRELEGLEQHGQVVPVDRPEVFDVEIGIQRGVVREPREEPVGSPAHSAVERTCRRTQLAEQRIRAAVQGLVRVGRADPVEDTGPSRRSSVRRTGRCR